MSFSPRCDILVHGDVRHHGCTKPYPFSAQLIRSIANLSYGKVPVAPTPRQHITLHSPCIEVKLAVHKMEAAARKQWGMTSHGK